MKQYKQELLDYGTKALLSIDGVRIIGTAKIKHPSYHLSLMAFILMI